MNSRKRISKCNWSDKEAVKLNAQSKGAKLEVVQGIAKLTRNQVFLALLTAIESLLQNVTRT